MSIPQGLQLDLVTVVARLRQLRSEPYFDCGHWLMQRVMTCDLPRLESHLTEEGKALLDRAEENYPRPEELS